MICGYDKPYKGWVSDNDGAAIAGICEECLNRSRGYAALEAKVEELEKKLEETGNAFDDVFDVNAKCQAQAAAMREALELFVYPVDSLDEYEAHQKGKQALSTDAGKELLEHMRKLHAIAKAARKLNKVLNIWINITKYHPLACELNKALAELEGGSNVIGSGMTIFDRFCSERCPCTNEKKECAVFKAQLSKCPVSAFIKYLKMQIGE